MDQQEIEEIFGEARQVAMQLATDGNLEAALLHLDKKFHQSGMMEDYAVQGFYWRARTLILEAHELNLEGLDASFRSADFYIKSNKPIEAAKSKVAAIGLFGRLNRLNDAEDLANKLLPMFEGFLFAQILIRQNLATAYSIAGTPNRALELYKQNYVDSLSLSSYDFALLSLMEIALELERLGEYDQALKSYRDIDFKITSLDSFRPKSNFQIKKGFNHAILLLKLGRFEEGLALLDTVRGENKLTIPSDKGFVNMAEGAIRSYLGDAELAVYYFEQAIDSFVHPHDKVETYLQMSQHWRTRGRNKLLDALEITYHALEELRESEHIPLKKLILTEQAEIHLALDQRKNAKEVAEEALELSTSDDRPILRRMLQLILAEATLPQTPQQSVIDLMEITADLNLPLEQTIRAKVSLGEAFFQLGNFRSAAAAFSESLSMIQNWGRSIKGHSSQAGLMEQIREPLEYLLECLVKLQTGGLQMMTVLEQVRSQALTEIGSEAYRYQAEGELRELFDRREQLMRQLDILMRPITHRSEESTIMNQAQIGEQESNRANVLKGELVRIEEAIRREQPEPLTAEASAEQVGKDEPLPADTALLTWFQAKENLFVMVKFQGKTEYYPLDVSIELVLADWQKLFRNWLRKKHGRAARGRARDIWANLVGPVRGIIDGADKLLIVPINQLWQIPFGGLIDGALDQHVGERWELVSAPSQSVWRMCHKRQATADGILLVGAAGDPNDDDYLPAVETEIDMLKGKYPQAELLRDVSVTRDNLVSQLSQNRLVHIAGHIEYDAARPVLSGIRLHDNRYFRASDFYLRPNSLTGTHVVLSGCDSGRVSQLGTEIIGLTSSLVAAGAKSVLVSLWPIDDAATAEFMSIYYDFLHESDSPSAALRAAQIKMMHHDTYNHPIYWAAFMSLFS